MDIKNLSGLELLTALKNGQISPSPMSSTIPMTLIEVEKGYIVYEVTPEQRHMNIQGGIHGGFCATALDMATGGAAHTVLEAGYGYGTIDLNVKMTRPLQVGKTYRAEANLINAGKNILITEGKIVDENQKVYAYGSATLMVIPKNR
nr:PaaI family thioesterase [Acinetobacter sp. Marseille-Q1620]